MISEMKRMHHCSSDTLTHNGALGSMGRSTARPYLRQKALYLRTPVEFSPPLPSAVAALRPACTVASAACAPMGSWYGDDAAKYAATWSGPGPARRGRPSLSAPGGGRSALPPSHGHLISAPCSSSTKRRMAPVAASTSEPLEKTGATPLSVKTPGSSFSKSCRDDAMGAGGLDAAPRNERS